MNARELKPVTLQTKIFDLYAESWKPITEKLIESSESGVANSHETLHCDLREPLHLNPALSLAVSEADVLFFSFVLHENASFIADKQFNTLLPRSALPGILENAPINCILCCMDAGNRLWRCIAEYAEALGWQGEMRDLNGGRQVSLGPKSYLIMERKAVSHVKRSEKITPKKVVEQISVASAIRDAAQYAKVEVSITGSVAMSAPDLSRLDISDGGAKLICDVSKCEQLELSTFSVGQRLKVDGVLRRRQRRLFFDATSCVAEAD